MVGSWTRVSIILRYRFNLKLATFRYFLGYRACKIARAAGYKSATKLGIRLATL